MRPRDRADLDALAPDSIERGADDEWSRGETRAAERGEAAPALAAPRLDTQSFLDRDAGDVPFESVDGAYNDNQVVVRIQHFAAGGFEGIGMWRSREARFQQRFPGIKLEKKERTEQEQREAWETNIRRAKRMVRWRVREIGADHLLTLTTREERNNPIDLYRKWERFVRHYRKVLGDDEQFHYVAVVEPHPTNPGHWHIHVAVRGRVHVNRARGIWWAICGGRGMGNVDARFIRCRAGADRAEKIASYISKYVSKAFRTGLVPSGRHRYRTSEMTLAERSKLIIETNGGKRHGLEQARAILMERLDIWPGEAQFFFFPDGTGFWFSSSGSSTLTSPF